MRGAARKGGPYRDTVPVAARCEVAPQQGDQDRVVEQNGATAAALGQHGDVLIVVGEVEVIDVDGQGLADAHAGGGEQGEQQPVAVFVPGDGPRHGIDVSGQHRTGREGRDASAVQAGHWVGVDQFGPIRPGQQ